LVVSKAIVAGTIQVVAESRETDRADANDASERSASVIVEWKSSVHAIKS
jgi:hypothetical protein